MEPNMTVIGFDPSAEFLTLFKDKLFRLTNISPYDSSFAVRIEKRGKQFEMSIVVHFIEGKMQASSQGTNLELTMTKTLDQLYKQIYQWHTERFKPGPTASPPVKPVRVLIVDDDPMSTQFLGQCLRKSGCETTSVSNGYAAVEKIASHKYDVIFLDWHMPEMNGSETLLSAQNLIAHDSALSSEFTKLRIPVITYSGKARKDIQLPECRYFRFVDHWDKSTPFHQLLNQASDVLFRFKMPELTAV